MPTPTIDAILILQNCDQRRLAVESQLRAIPEEIALVDKRITVEKSAIETARAEMRELEARKKVLETEIRSAEEKLGKYKTQQMQVRKNEEFQALGNEIVAVQGAIAGLEEQEIEILYSIDEAKRRFQSAEATLKANIEGHEARIRTLRERGEALGQELGQARDAVAAARTPLDPLALRLYDRVAAQKMPVCAPINAGKCGGCHLKVSSEVESASRGRDPDIKLPLCDQCGRIVYWEA